MGWRLLRLSLAVSVLVVFPSALKPGLRTVHADTHSCTSDYTMDGYYYSDGRQFTHEAGSLFAPDMQSYGDCLAAVQNSIVAVAASYCRNQGGIGVGSTGVGFMSTTWHVVWDGVDQNPDGAVQQQFDCGDISG
jgi:hypothetical protein